MQILAFAGGGVKEAHPRAIAMGMSYCPYSTYATMSCVWHRVMDVFKGSLVCATAFKLQVTEILFYQK